MSLAGRIIAHLTSRDVSGAVIGGVAMAVHGIARATVDLDVLVAATSVLDNSFWGGLGTDVAIDVRRGDASDPLAGVVRCSSAAEVLDVVVGRSRWMESVISRATPRELAGEQLPVVDAADLVLLKLYAAGPQDLLDVRLLFAADPKLHAVALARSEELPPSVLDRLKELVKP